MIGVGNVLNVKKVVAVVCRWMRGWVGLKGASSISPTLLFSISVFLTLGI
jgi:hypothetical protein